MQPKRCPAPLRLSSRLTLGAPVFMVTARAAFCVILPIFAGLVFANAAHAQGSGSWYYCDPLHGYYPYVSICPVPWRVVQPYAYGQVPSPEGPAVPAQAAPAPTLVPPTEAQPSSSYQLGQADRQAWEIWFGTVTGNYRAGAEWWAGHRSLPSPRSCAAAPPSTGADWTAGCFAAQEKLTPSDLRRKGDPEYRLGWNSPAPVAPSPTATEGAGTPTAQTQARAPSATQILEPKTSDTQSATQQSHGGYSQQPSPAASSVAAPVASQSSSENQTPIAPKSSNEGWIIPAAVVLIGGGGWAILKKRRRDEALRIVAAEVDSHTAILHVKRLQTVLPDDYGTVFLDKWTKEKDYYVETRILPALRVKGLDAIYGALASRIDGMIEEAAQRSISPELDIATRFISNPEIFDQRMEPIDYEKHCALQLEKAGWRTRLTATTGDQGADVIADRAGKVLVLQCKLYSSPVGNDAVQQVIAARQFQSADLAAVASNQPFTRSAKQLAAVSGVHLLHHEQLASFAG
jgi:restriction system protein